MPLRPTLVCVILVSLLASTALRAQSPASPTETSVPRFVRVSGTFTPADHMPTAPVETMALALYADETGGTPLWQETQYVTVDADGHYRVLLGATLADGLPLDLFASGEARWLGRRFERNGETEQARVLLASVPYALKASDANTLGGRPPSAYLLADTDAVGGGSTNSGGTKHGKVADTTSPSDVRALTAGSANFIGKFVNGTDLGNSSLYDAGGFVGLNTTNPLDALHVRFTNTNGTFTGYAVQNLGNTATSYSGMLFYDQNGALGQFQGFNNSTHEYRINNIASSGSINFLLGGVSKLQVRADGDVEMPGAIRKGGGLFLHLRADSTFLGVNAGNATMIGSKNTAYGDSVLRNNTTGANNTATGYDALSSNTTGSHNTASGIAALRENTTGDANTANGESALFNNTTGKLNTAVGQGALLDNNGDENTAVGRYAGINATTGSNNIYLGANVVGVAGEANTMYLGGGNQTRAFIGGVRGRTTSVNNAIPVMIDSAGQLGTISSSRRFKEDIHDMGDASRALLALRPVTFRYAQAYSDGAKPIQYGLVAEEVAEVFPDLAVRNAEGGVDTVHYETLSVLLLNEMQKQRSVTQQQNETLTRQIEMQQQRIETLERRLNELLAK